MAADNELTNSEQSAFRRNMEYWTARELEAAKQYRLSDEEVEKRIQQGYYGLLQTINDRISGFYTRYARSAHMTIAQAEQAVSKMDVKAYEARAAELVKKKDFSDKANAELKLYNATMRINRLELLKSNIGLDLVEFYNDVDTVMEEHLTDRAREEYRRQAGILGQSIHPVKKDLETIVNASFHNAKFSWRIWNGHTQLKSTLATLLTDALTQGRGARELAELLTAQINVEYANAVRLLRTEIARVQTAVQKDSFEKAGFEYFVFIALESGCSICKRLDTEHNHDAEPIPVKDMMPGVNAPPMHPNCRCSTAAWMVREAYEEWLDSGAAAEGVSWEEWQALTNKETESWQKSTESFASGPIMSSLNNPAITNSDEVVQNFVDAVEISDELKNSECFLNSVRHMPKDDLDMIARHGLIVKTTNGTNAFNARKARGADGKLKYVIKINPKSTEPYVFAHECAHMAEKINHLYKDPEFVEVLNNFGKSVTGIFPGEVNGEWYCTAVSDLLIEPYQGRTYVRHMGRYGPERNIVLTDFVEYISDGYECFIGDPELLASKDLMLYNYFKRRGLR